MENAMSWLAETDADYAMAKTDVLRAEILCKRVRARIFATVDGSIEARKSAAEVHADVISADDELVRATLEYESLRAKRQRAELLIDVWRSVESSRRKS
jgi:hypothetical protein